MVKSLCGHALNVNPDGSGGRFLGDRIEGAICYDSSHRGQSKKFDRSGLVGEARTPPPSCNVSRFLQNRIMCKEYTIQHVNRF